MTNTRVAIITGGASGIGAAFSRLLASEGIKVIIADRQMELAQSVVDDILAAGGHAQAVELNVTDATAVAAVVTQVHTEEQRIDFMFNNAGIGIGGSALRHDMSDWDDIIDVNIRGVVLGIQAVYPIMKEQGFGQIINTSSMAGLVPIPAMIAYSASKHAVYAMSRVLRAEASEFGVQVNTLCPGFINTPILDGGAFGRMKLDEQQREQMQEQGGDAMDVNEFVVKAWHQLKRNRAIIIVPGLWRLVWWFYRVLPLASVNYLQRRVSKVLG